MGLRRAQNSKALQQSNSEESLWLSSAPTTTTLGRVPSSCIWLPANWHLIPGSASGIWRSLPDTNLHDFFHLFRNCSDNVALAPSRVFCLAFKTFHHLLFPHQISLHPPISLISTFLSGLHPPPGILLDAPFAMSIPWSSPHLQDPLKPLLIFP